MDRILINDILQFSSEDIDKVKIKFNKHNGNTDPLEMYKENPEGLNVQWLLWHKSRRYFHKGQIAICFLRIDTDIWLLTTIKQITKELDVPVDGGIGYEAVDVEKFRKYFGRVLVKYHNKTMSMGRTYKSLMGELEVLEILNDHFTGNDFPGYENIRLTYGQLKNIIDRKLPGWLPALQNQKAVYLITDTSNGQLYVGSATAQYGMLLQRWSEYVSNGHGGNVGLKQVVAEKGLDHVKKHFLYSVLENYNARMDDKYILMRESWWKETLKTREFGLNKN